MNKIITRQCDYPIDDVLRAFKAGYVFPHVANNIEAHLNELKFSRPKEAQEFIDELVGFVQREEAQWHSPNDAPLLDKLIQEVTTDRILNGTPHTFGDLGDEIIL